MRDVQQEGKIYTHSSWPIDCFVIDERDDCEFMRQSQPTSFIKQLRDILSTNVACKYNRID